MSTSISLTDIAAASLTNFEMIRIQEEMRGLDERIGKLLSQGHGPACSCPACLAAGQVAIGEFVADLTALRWLLKRRVFFSPAWLLSDAEARQRWAERQEERRAEKASPPLRVGDQPSPVQDETASPIPAVEVGAPPLTRTQGESKPPRTRKVA